MGVKGRNNINSDNYGILLNGDRTQWLVKRGDTEVRTIDIEAFPGRGGQSLVLSQCIYSGR